MPVRLALFAEMVKGKPWTPATLREVGGMDGVGVKFLEETFSSGRSNPEHRYHQRAAQAVLKSLLPETNSDIKGRMRSSQELRQASGYSDRPDDFDHLIRILDSDLRLITPVDLESWVDEWRVATAGPGAPTGPQAAVLPAHARLPRPCAARLVDAQAEVDLARTNRALARGALGAVECEARGSSSAVVPAEWATIRLLLSQAPAVDRARAPDDEAIRPQGGNPRCRRDARSRGLPGRRRS